MIWITRVLIKSYIFRHQMIPATLHDQKRPNQTTDQTRTDQTRQEILSQYCRNQLITCLKAYPSVHLIRGPIQANLDLFWILLLRDYLWTLWQGFDQSSWNIIVLDNTCVFQFACFLCYLPKDGLGHIFPTTCGIWIKACHAQRPTLGPAGNIIISTSSPQNHHHHHHHIIMSKLSSSLWLSSCRHAKRPAGPG